MEACEDVSHFHNCFKSVVFGHPRVLTFVCPLGTPMSSSFISADNGKADLDKWTWPFLVGLWIVISISGFHL